jgi:hypothetical protein
MTPKKIQDVVIAKRTIRDIPLPTRGNEREMNFNPGFRNPRFASSVGVWLVALVSVVILVAAFSVFFTGAKVIAVPKTFEIPIDINITASKLPDAGKLGFEYLTIKRDEREVVPAVGEEYVESRASGRIVIYNNFSSSPQRLITNTRFETPSGLVFRIKESVIVPGQRKEGGVLVPGSVESVVYADAPGAEYNIGLSDFTIPGFKNDSARYKGFYARSKTAMTGGFSGVVKKISTETLRVTEENLRERLKNNIVTAIKAEVPTTAVFYPTALFMEYEALPQESVTESSAAVVMSASSTAVFFNRAKLSELLATKYIPEYAGEAVMVVNLDSLEFALAPGQTSPLNSDTLSFVLKGQAKFVYQINTAALAKDLAGKNKKDMGEVIKNHRSVDRTEVVIRPIWKNNFPTNPEKIKILVKQGESNNK